MSIDIHTDVTFLKIDILQPHFTSPLHFIFIFAYFLIMPLRDMSAPR